MGSVQSFMNDELQTARKDLEEMRMKFEETIQREEELLQMASAIQEELSHRSGLDDVLLKMHEKQSKVLSDMVVSLEEKTEEIAKQTVELSERTNEVAKHRRQIELLLSKVSTLEKQNSDLRKQVVSLKAIASIDGQSILTPITSSCATRFNADKSIGASGD